MTETTTALNPDSLQSHLEGRLSLLEIWWRMEEQDQPVWCFELFFGYCVVLLPVQAPAEIACGGQTGQIALL